MLQYSVQSYLDPSTHLQLLSTGRCIALAVQVVRVEREHCLEHVFVFFVHQFMVGTFSVPGIERVVSNHRQALSRECGLVLDNVIEVFVVSPGEHNIIQADSGGINAKLCLVNIVVVVFIVLERIFSKNDSIVERTADREGVSNDIPLPTCTEEEQKFAEVMDEANQLHPARLPIFSQSLRSLEEMSQLGLLSVRVTFVHECIQLLKRFPDRHFGSRLTVEVLPCLQVESCSLESMLLSIERLHTVACIVELPKCGGIFVLVELRLLVDVVIVSLAPFVGVDMVDIVRDSTKHVHTRECDSGSHCVSFVVRCIVEYGK